MARQETANTIINRVALEVGLSPVSDPVADSDDAFIQLTGLLNAAGQELVELRPWQVLRNEFEFTTDSAADSGVYTLPADFSYMIPQAHWDQTSNVPIGGPLSAQSWAYMEGRGLASSTIYMNFRLAENKLEIYPQPPPDALAVRFEYISRYWVTESGQSAPNTDAVDAGTDTIVYEPILIQKFLKVKFLEAKGLDASAARLEFENMFLSRSGKDEGSPILSASRTRGRTPYLNSYNTLDTGFGS